MTPLVTPRGVLVAPTSLVDPTTDGVYVLTLRLDAASAKSLPAIDGYEPEWSVDGSNADFTFKAHGYEWWNDQKRRHAPPPVFDVRARPCRNTNALTPGSVVRVSFHPRGFALIDSATFFGFVPVDALHLSAVQVFGV